MYKNITQIALKGIAMAMGVAVHGYFRRAVRVVHTNESYNGIKGVIT